MTISQRISISLDDIWVGYGKLTNGYISDCGIVWCDDENESESIYQLIETSIAEGISAFGVEIDGKVHKISWNLEDWDIKL